MSTEIVEIVASLVFVYTIMSGIGWHVGGGHWDDPGPFFCGLLWPIVLPAYGGAVLARSISKRLRAPRLPYAKVICKDKS